MSPDRKRGVYSLIAFAAFMVLAAGSGQQDPGGSSSGSPRPPSTKQMAIDSTVLVFNGWQKDGFGTVMIADFTIRNKGSRPVKDFEITCIHSAASGTEMDRNVRTLYERVNPKGVRRFRSVEMGFIDTQVKRSHCEITDLVVE